MNATLILQLIIALLPVIEQLPAELQVIVPIARKVLKGEEPTVADIEALASIETDLNAKAATAESAV